jgi:hypothetical protein
MSKSLGMVQRRIIEALKARPGGEKVEFADCSSFVLAPGIHDLRQVSKALARERGALYGGGYVCVGWQASFSRAVAGLAARGCIEVPSLVRIIDAGKWPLRWRVHNLADGSYIDQPRRQRRFVQLSAELHNT